MMLLFECALLVAADTEKTVKFSTCAVGTCRESQPHRWKSLQFRISEEQITCKRETEELAHPKGEAVNA